MKLYVTTGTRTQCVTMPNIELDPDHVFQACNRISDADDDTDLLRRKHGPGSYTDGLIKLRYGLDHHAMPSMSVGDSIEVVSDTGTKIVRFTCEPSGWSATKIAPATAARPNRVPTSQSARS